MFHAKQNMVKKGSSSTKDMTLGSPYALMIGFALPTFLSQVFQQLYNTADAFIVGRFLGTNALAAVTSSGTLIFLLVSLFMGIAMGGGVVISRYFGAGDETQVSRAIHTMLAFGVVSGIILTIVGVALTPTFLVWMQTDPEVMPEAVEYFRYYFLGALAMVMYNVCRSVMNALGDSQRPLYYLIFSSLVNIVLDLLFVMGFRWGIAGAAAATVIAQLSSSIYCYIHIRKVEILSLSREDFRLEKNLDWKLIFLGLPMALQNAIIAVGGMIVQTVVNGFGVIFIAGFTATNKLYGVLEVAATSYGYAMITYAGQNLGAGKIERIKKGMKSAILVAIATAAIIAVCMLVFGHEILGCFISGTPEEVEMTMNIAYHYLAIMSICLPILYILHVVRSALQGMGDTLLPMVSGIVEFAMRTGTAILLPMAIGEEGIFYAEILAWMGADAILVSSYLVRVKKLDRMNKKEGGWIG